MDPATLSVLMSAGVGAFTGIGESYFNAQEAQKNRDFQREERIASQQFNLDMWNMNNEYNSLSSQIDRAKEAGVNPNAILGNGSNVASQPVKTTPMSGAQASYNSGFPSALLSQAKTIAEIEKIKAETKGKNLENDFFQKTLDERVKQLGLQTEKLSTEMQKDLADIGKTDIETKTLEKSFEYLGRMNETELQLMNQELTNLYNQNEKVIQEIVTEQKKQAQIDKSMQVQDKQMQVMNADIVNTSYDTLHKSQDIAYITQKTKTEAANTEGTYYDTQIKALQLKVSQETKIPIGTPEFHAQFWLFLTGQLQSYIDNVVRPSEQATWRPMDWRMDYGNYHKSSNGFHGDKGIFNPTRQGSQMDYFREGSEIFENIVPW